MDAGYLRILLYYGLLGIPLLFLQYLILFKLSDNVTPDFLCSLYLFRIIKLKGRCFLYSNNTLPIIIGFLYFYNHKMKTTLSCSNVNVSIITPNYNSGKYIEETILSVINQTYKSWEMIIVDDCSTDNSVNILRLPSKMIELN